MQRLCLPSLNEEASVEERGSGGQMRAGKWWEDSTAPADRTVFPLGQVGATEGSAERRART